MHIEINDNTSLREIGVVFSAFYPYLELAFFKKAHEKYEASKEIDCIDPDMQLGDMKKPHVAGLLEILPLSKVADVEKEFQSRFGLSAQVLRKTGDGWEQTTGMDDFNLKELNEMGRNSSDEFIVEDYEEGFEEPEEKPEKLY